MYSLTSLLGILFGGFLWTRPPSDPCFCECSFAGSTGPSAEVLALLGRQPERCGPTQLHCEARKEKEECRCWFRTAFVAAVVTGAGSVVAVVVLTTGFRRAPAPPAITVVPDQGVVGGSAQAVDDPRRLNTPKAKRLAAIVDGGRV